MVDPVMVSTSGDVLAGPSILSTFRYVIAFFLLVFSNMYTLLVLHKRGCCAQSFHLRFAEVNCCLFSVVFIIVSCFQRGAPSNG